MKQWVAFLLAFISLVFIHEGTHALIAAMYDEYGNFQVRPLGFEVIYKTDIIERNGINGHLSQEQAIWSQYHWVTCFCYSVGGLSVIAQRS